jgi:hypothetical protein
MDLTPFPDQQPGETPQPTPMVYVNENPSWEYKLFVRDLELDNAPGEDEINPLGAEGWELVGIFVHANMLYCYFKRLK